MPVPARPSLSERYHMLYGAFERTLAALPRDRGYDLLARMEGYRDWAQYCEQHFGAPIPASRAPNPAAPTVWYREGAYEVAVSTLGEDPEMLWARLSVAGVDGRLRQELTVGAALALGGPERVRLAVQLARALDHFAPQPQACTREDIAQSFAILVQGGPSPANLLVASELLGSAARRRRAS